MGRIKIDPEEFMEIICQLLKRAVMLMEQRQIPFQAVAVKLRDIENPLPDLIRQTDPAEWCF
mgnify:FL=1